MKNIWILIVCIASIQFSHAMPLPYDGEEATAPGINLVLVPAGSFLMGSKLAPDEQPIHEVTVGSFLMADKEVTYLQYAEFLNQVLPDKTELAKWILINNESKFSHIFFYAKKYHVDSGWDNNPVTNISWEGAVKFCEYYRLRLPTEAEWEYAAGGSYHTQYPWGDEWVENQACYEKNVSFSTPATVVVGSYPPNDYELYDMAGNVWEWCSDWYDAGYFTQSPHDNPQGPASGTSKVIKGGSWLDEDKAMRCANRKGVNPADRLSYIGFRPCASAE
jgi:formylglycine-generating enzyme required for sulfatase activity